MMTRLEKNEEDVEVEEEEKKRKLSDAKEENTVQQWFGCLSVSLTISLCVLISVYLSIHLSFYSICLFV